MHRNYLVNMTYIFLFPVSFTCNADAYVLGLSIHKGPGYHDIISNLWKLFSLKCFDFLIHTYMSKLHMNLIFALGFM